MAAVGDSAPSGPLGQWSERFRALSDPSRLRIVLWIASAGELCARDFEQPLGLGQPTVSHHLSVLREARILSSERRGVWVYYRLHQELPPDLMVLISALLEAIPAQGDFFGTS